MTPNASSARPRTLPKKLVKSKRKAAAIVEQADVAPATVLKPMVYIIHDAGGKNYVPALSFGNIKILLHGTDEQVFDTTSMVRRLREGLKAYQPQDYVILVGDPVAIAVTGMILSEDWDRIKLLKWDKQERVYVPVTIDLREE